jgi:ATP-dependent DNA helicase 2 subunit 2
MSGRAGYCLVVYAVDVSPSMGDAVADIGNSGKKKAKLDWVKEYIAREVGPRVSE